MLEVEVFGADLAPDCPPAPEVQRICEATAARLDVADGHLAIEFVDRARIAELNGRHRERDGATDVLSFPIDGLVQMPPGSAPRELGDVVICPAETADIPEAIVHGVLHLLGMDHETDEGEMLALQRDVLEGLGA
jgi:probable rRNA maturation factor